MSSTSGRFVFVRLLGLRLLGLGLAGLGLAASPRAEAQTVVTPDPTYQSDPSYAGPLIRGEYVGAPLTRVPRPTELVPSAWGYGTYGVPTVTGIRPAPVGTPTVYVIDTPPRALRQARRTGPRIVSRDARGRWTTARPRPEPGMTPMAATSPQAAARVVTVSAGRTASR